MASRVKNKSASAVQITAEQLLREAAERQLDTDHSKVKQTIMDVEELQDFQLMKRQHFEDNLRMKRGDVRIWMRYAKFEETQGEIDRARSIYERAIDTDYRQPVFWLKYAEMEMRQKYVNHARNVFDRAITLLPREHLLWYRYVFMEEKLGNFAGVRRLYERWMQWEPEQTAFEAYIKFEKRYGEEERARGIYARMAVVHASVDSYLRWAASEQELGEVENARAVYEMGVDILGPDARLLAAFAKFEAEDAREVERARAIYRFALDRVSEESANVLFRAYSAFEKQHGDREGIEKVIAGKRRIVYEEQVKENAFNYDAWFDYAALEESHGTLESVREVLERAIANVPPATEKRLWRRYVYLWIRYAIFEELDAGDVTRARTVYREALGLVPHARFSFTKLWTMYAHFELRQGDLTAARKIFGTALGRAPKPRVFENYIDMEVRLGNTERARALFEKYVDVFRTHAAAWTEFASLEAELHEYERVRAIYELAVSQDDLDTPEVAWKAYLDFEIEQGNRGAVRKLYRRLLQKTQHPRVWESCARYEAEEDAQKARLVYQEGFEALKGPHSKDERYMLLDLWKAWEQQDGGNLQAISDRMPKRVKKRRKVAGGATEEYYEYIFPDEEKKPNLKLLEMAHAWKKSKK